MFKSAKVGDRAYDILRGWGTIRFINKDGNYPIHFITDTCIFCTYTFEGKRAETDIMPSLFWDKVKFEIPEKPFSLENELRKLEIIEFKFGKNNYILIWNNKYNIIDFDCFIDYQSPLTLYFTRESILNLFKNIDKRNITREQFLIAYEKVFGRKIIYDRSVN